ncbi:hypothetical protein [Comamonas aquatica]|uniref:hypothetical protein n=1 Tax=Comamonas aquatica TaxID=225991 RepID=UPI00244C8B30|nr:hypothetical protein [Comamonas aquatica]MDH1816261.1 hypothetical protein [Comamonas aquatica]
MKTNDEIGASVEPLRKPAAPQAVQAAVPDAGQSRFKGEKDWHWCSPEHVAMVLATPSEWQGYEARYLYAHAAPAHPAEGVPATIRMLDDRAAFEASVQKEHYWEGIRENLFDRLPSGKYAVVGIERHWQTWMAALAGTQPAAPGQRAPLTDAQIKEGRNAVNDDPDDRPEPWAFREGVKFAERMHGITQEKQG